MQKILATLALALTLQACNTVGPRQCTLPPTAVTKPTVSLVDPITIENLLRWPLDGAAGRDKVVAALSRLFEMKPLRASQSSGEGPVRLVDGHVLSFAHVRNLSGDIDIGIDAKSCIDPDWAAAVTGAMLNSVDQDTHGVDRGKQYDVTGNAMALRINTTPVTYRCVTAIHIYPLPTERP
ncbi:hypothetical protein [Lysobacter sp. TAB13]|uniref:hypothetical protein n=1 Tax=Lysobacter sp. TAB13 TaxID=3233065 RepID=UPI003F9837D7